MNKIINVFIVALAIYFLTTGSSFARTEIPPENPQSGDVWKEPVTGMEFVFVKGGCYQMGLSNEEKEWFIKEYGKEYYDKWLADERPLHRVCLDSFWIGRYEVTQGEWGKVMGKNPSQFKNGSNYPVEQVSWDDVQVFIKRLNRKTRMRFRLPTESEWEYAARSGGKQERYAGTSDEGALYKYSNFCDLNCEQILQTKGQDDGYEYTAPVGSYKPNGLGLYDMSGNVMEWVQEVYAPDAYEWHSRNNHVYDGFSGYRVVRVYEGFGDCRTVRGGSWSCGPHRVRCTHRECVWPSNMVNDCGFRLLIDYLSHSTR